jgi:hypothetical protein
MAIVAALLMGCSDSVPKEAAKKTCVEPENPYDEGTGHYAGYKWAEENSGDCNGNSTSFSAGCEEYDSQRDKYETCEAGEK